MTPRYKSLGEDTSSNWRLRCSTVMWTLTKMLSFCVTAYQMAGRLSLVSKTGDPCMDMIVDVFFQS